MLCSKYKNSDKKFFGLASPVKNISRTQVIFSLKAVILSLSMHSKLDVIFRNNDGFTGIRVAFTKTLTIILRSYLRQGALATKS
jgi:hypothetical protein